MSAARLAVRAVVSSHDAGDARTDGFPERREIRLPHVLKARSRVEAVACVLRPRMHGKMLRTRRRLQEFPFALKPFYVRYGAYGRKIRVLAERLLTSAPAPVAEDIDVRRPEGQTLVYAAVAETYGFVVFRPSLIGDRVTYPPDQSGVERRRKSYRLREHRCGPRPRDAVRRLVPPVVFLYAEAFYRRRGVKELTYLLVRIHQPDFSFGCFFCFVEVHAHLIFDRMILFYIASGSYRCILRNSG